MVLGPRPAGTWGFSHLPYGRSCRGAPCYFLWWLYLFQGANYMPGELCDGSAHPLSVLVSITRYKVHLKRVIVSSSNAWGNQTCCSKVTQPVSHQAAGKAGNICKSPPSLFSALSAFSPLSLPKYFCSSPFSISLTLSQNKQRVVLKHSTVHLIRTSIRTKLQIKQLHYSY